ncbi:SURF1 family protein [Luteimicrobium subarcticum]|uniref:SURF1-like protein n=1 Tax=Luteimicrobium subarcticum TaxID=620910 RepID=A0A2M8WWF3_9MICO|nr:SURF1 family protein [Luteimicrobium subarcticum]PJI95258.1 cytochrome oxidase assembly protein ShyY1 [Luteimicrobium subarcticum]
MAEVRHGARTRRQWVTLAVGAVIMALLCLVAARWQWARYDLHRSQAEQISGAYTADPVSLGTLVPGPGDTFAADDEWRPVTVRGHYEPDDTVLLRNRPVGTGAVFHVLVPFVVDAPGDPTDQMVLVVDRGTVPLSNGGALRPDDVPAPPAGELTLTARLRPDEPVTTRTAPPGQVQAISTPMVLAQGADGAAWADGRTTDAYLVADSEDPSVPAADADHTVTPLPTPDLPDAGTNMSYTVQWCLFAAGLLGAYIVLWRRERGPRLTAGDLLAGHTDVDEAEAARAARRSGKPRRVSLEDEEDAYLDAQEAAIATRAGERERQASDTSSA